MLFRTCCPLQSCMANGSTPLPPLLPNMAQALQNKQGEAGCQHQKQAPRADACSGGGGKGGGGGGAVGWAVASACMLQLGQLSWVSARAA